MRSHPLFRLALAVVPLLAVAAVPALAHEGVVSTEQERIHLDLAADEDLTTGWSCTEWHELYPEECAVRHLEEIEGDGELRECNYAKFDDGRYHIDWVGPTYFLDCGWVAEPSSGMNADGDPTGEIWHEVKPDYCKEHVVTRWDDANGNGELDECDFVAFDDGQVCHIYRISVDIIISPAPSTDPDPDDPIGDPINP